MNDSTWELFDALYKTAHRQGRRIEELESRVEALTLRLAVMYVPLSRGKMTLIDAEDYERIRAYTWHAHVQNNKWYAYGRNKEGRQVKMHRLLIGARDGQWVDHANGDGLDNRKSNLRLATPSENAQNVPLYKNNKSGFKGVGFHKATGKWAAFISANKVQHHLGLFDDPSEAARAYDKKAIELHGEFARLNFPELERRLRDHDAEALPERPVLRAVETAEVPA